MPSATSNPHLEAKVLNQEVSESDGEGDYRLYLFADDAVRYVHIQGGVFSEPFDFLWKAPLPHLLPLLPKGDWLQADISRSSDGALRCDVAKELPPGVPDDCIFHSRRVDLLSLPVIRKLSARAFESMFEGNHVIVKVANFLWQTPWVTSETKAYAHLSTQDVDEDSELDTRLTPRFLGHVTEHNRSRIMGLMVEKLPGRHADAADQEACRAALEKLHSMGVVHGDVNRYNFLLSEVKGKQGQRQSAARLIDFEHAEPWSEEAAEEELASLLPQLKETSGRGTVTVDDDDGEPQIKNKGSTSL